MLTKEKILSLLREELKEKKAPLKPFTEFKPYYFISRNLPCPDDRLPRIMKKAAKECQAINWMIEEAKKTKLLDSRTGTGHKTGLFLWGLAAYSDIKDDNEDGWIWAETFFEENRQREYTSQEWNTHLKKDRDNPTKLFPKCETLETRFGKCDGCPFRGKINSPVDLVFGREIKGTWVKNVNLVHVNDVRTKTFKEFEERLTYLVNNNVHKDLALVSNQGTGKSVCIDDIAVKLASQGKNILIAVPSTKLAIEHQKRTGGFVMYGHEKIFELNGPAGEVLGIDFECPFGEIIQYGMKLGIGSGYYKEKHCQNCPFRAKCPWPGQYDEAILPEKKIIIIQHAHLKATEALNWLLRKQFDVMFIDEGFFDNLVNHIIPIQLEYELISSLGFGWSQKMAKWLRDGGKPEGHISVTEDEASKVSQAFGNNSLPWNFPEYVRMFNSGIFHNTNIGLNIFHPIPIVPIRVFVDATLPRRTLQLITDNSSIEYYGENEIIDYRLNHKDTKIIQILDKPLSKASLQKNDADRYYELLEIVGDKSKYEYPDKKILLTTFLDESPTVHKTPFAWQTEAKDWLYKNYPDIIDRLTFGHMVVGTNEFEDFDVQFLLAGVNRSGRDTYEQIYRLKVIANFWNRIKNRKEVSFQIITDKNPGSQIIDIPVRKIMPRESGASVVEFNMFKSWVPTDYWMDIVREHNISTTQQSMRLRLMKEDKPRTVYIFGNEFMPGLLITDISLEDNLKISPEKFSNM